MKNVDLKTITYTQSWYKIWQLNGYNHTRVQPNRLRRRSRVLRKVLEPSDKPTVIFSDRSVEFEELVKNDRGIMYPRHMALLREQCRIKDGTSAVLFQSGLDGLEGSSHKNMQPQVLIICGHKFRPECLKQLNENEKQQCGVEKPKLENARKLRGRHLLG